MTEPRRPRVPEFDPALDGPWDGRKRPPVDPGTNRRAPQRSRRFRQFEPNPTNETHEERLTRAIAGE